MLEIPESATIARQLNDTIIGKTIESIIANASEHKFAWFFGDPNEYDAQLRGKTIGSAYAIAGQVEVQIEDMRLLFHDGVNARFIAPGGKLPQKHQLLMSFTDGSAIVCTVQMYGGMWAFPEGANDNPYYHVAKEKPNPLSDDFDFTYFKGIYNEAKPSLSVKGLLATEQRIPGLGNGTLQDILFNARIHPKAKVSSLTGERLETLFNSVKETLREMTQSGGRNTEKDLFGKSGGYQTLLSSKTWMHPCPDCGGSITRQAYMGGNVYFCVSCQGS